MTQRLREQLRSAEPCVAIGVYDGLSARVAQEAGARALYASGGAIARSTGVPDIGLLSMTEVVDRLRAIVAASSVPLVADADTGYGGVRNVARTVREFERAGVAAVQIEDQALPKRCGHLSGKRLEPVEEMVAKIVAAREVREDPDLVIIARTDAIAVEGFEAAVARVKRYKQAGADVLFVEAPETVEQIQVLPELVEGPLMFNRGPKGGRIPEATVAELASYGYRLIIFPTDLQLATIPAMRRITRMILDDGSTHGSGDLMATFPEREALVGLDRYDAFERKVHAAAVRIVGVEP
ncbi:isocitrate lyase/PEP mutase family protein [Limnochorda pilosa]|uniref:Isocitrate lyase n=1 Tax=Limnochorda pilosa TaxID=1555112 RepID=A0A0K2SMH8_LIMPI|nr:isocitrate lyase/PEP mutase family protein [Limnochorda pilosa]BAS28034.1 isocitrate lyase [Limnochorda pilosa]